MTMIFDHNNNSEDGKTIESLNNPTNYPPINLVVTPALAPWKTTVEIEEHRKNITFDHYRQSSAQNIKINEIANDLKQGEVVSHKLIANALITQKAPSDTPHDDDLDQFKTPK
ncbi:hypothetical protein Hpkin71_11070 [Helicobacter pylori]